MTTEREYLDKLLSQEPITACTRCGREIGRLTSRGRCQFGPLGKHKWWTGTRREWDKVTIKVSFPERYNSC
jgi:hypothetical protein